MKKTIAFVLTLLVLVGMSACSTTGEKTTQADTLPLTELMDQILEGVPDLPKVQSTELTTENFEAFAFVKPTDGVTGVVSEALIGSIAHSVVLLRAGDSAAAEALAKDVEANVNPRKWICVEAEKTNVSVHGSTVLLVMSFENTADTITANFDALWQ